MSDKIPMPSALTEDAVAEWIAWMWRQRVVVPIDRYAARAVLALVEAKVREAVVESQDDPGHIASVRNVDLIVARVMGREVRRV